MTEAKKKLGMTSKIVIATILGVLAGWLLGERAVSIKLLGDIFLRLIQMSIVLLVLGQIVEAVGNLNPRELGKVGLKTLVIFAVSSLLAAAFGVFIASMFKVGKSIDTDALGGGEIITAQAGSVSETILSFFPSNIIQSMASGTIVHLIVFAILFGVALSFIRVNSEHDLLMKTINQFNDTIIKLIYIVMQIAPIGVFALIASTIGQMGVQVVLPLAKYIGIYGMGTFIFLAVWILIVSVYCRVGILKLCRNMMNMSLLALVTTSSAITLPVAMADAESKLGISKPVTKLVLPLGVSLNSNGAAMHIALTIVTIAQIYGIEYSMTTLMYIVVLATLTSLANAVVPGAGLISLAIVVPAMNLPLESIALFAGVEWFTGMLRTILNVDSDVFSAMLVAKSENQLDHKVFNE